MLARGRNLWNQQQDPTAHGEMVAIRRFLAEHGMEKLKGTTLYTSGESCPMCMGALVWCGIARVVFGASIAQLAAKMGQITITDAEILTKTPFAEIAAKHETIIFVDGEDMVRGELVYDPEHGWIGQVDWSTQDVWESYPSAVAARG